jgi:hypothetical protein
MGEFKSSSPRPGLRRWIVVAVVVVAAAGAAFAAGRLSVKTPAVAASPVSGIRYVEGVPVGFPATVRGGGDAAAWYETLLSAVASRPGEQVHALLARLVTPAARPGLVEQLAASIGRVGNGGIWQTVVVRVWAAGSDQSAQVPLDTRVTVKTYGMGLFGVGTDGQSAGVDAGLAGGFAVHELTVQLDPDGWHLFAVQVPVPAPPPDLRGLTRDGGPTNTQLLAEVLGPDSWVPNMP